MNSAIDQKKVFIWGTGKTVKGAHKIFSEEIKSINLAGYITNNAKKWGEEIYGKKIYSPKILESEQDIVILLVTIYKAEILKQIKEEYPHQEKNIISPWWRYFSRIQILRRYADCADPEIKGVINYLKCHELQNFNYAFTEKYVPDELEICYDHSKQMYYANFCGKKMYFPKAFTEEEIKTYYSGILLEQDISSPHRYLTETFDVPNDAVIIDAGVAEGNFALSVIDRAKKIYLFEPDPEWLEALSYTFKPYEEKIIIIDKCLSNFSDNSTTTIDEVLKGDRVDFIKMDVEGEEYYALLGAEQTIKKSINMKCAICTYHQEFAYLAIEELLRKYNFALESSNGYMWFHDTDNFFRAPVLRRGVIRDVKRER